MATPAGSFTELMETQRSNKVNEAPRTGNRKNSAPACILIYVLEARDNEKTSEAARGKARSGYRGAETKMKSDFSAKTMADTRGIMSES